MKIPSYGGATPKFIQNQGDYLKALFMGLFLGNAGIACPNPATYVILTYIAGTGSVAYGAALQAVNGLGRFLPLFALVILAIVGVNASAWVLRRERLVRAITAWLLIVVGAFIIVWGLYGHWWFLNTPIHEGWTMWFASSVGAGAAEYQCCIDPPCSQCLEGWIWGPGVCKCRAAVADGRLEEVCPECRAGLAEGRSVFEIAERMQGPAFGLLGILILGPVIWYLAKRKFKKVESDQNKLI